ncbi:MAG: helix-turn-helix domain-containing protein [Gaiellaceae bacterium]
MTSHEVPPLYLSIQRAGDLCSVSTSTLRRWIERGDIRAVAVGGRTLIATDDLRAFLDRHKQTKPKNDDGPPDSGPLAKEVGDGITSRVRPPE